MFGESGSGFDTRMEQWWTDIPLTLLRAELARREELVQADARIGADIALGTAAAPAAAPTETQTQNPACGSQGLRGSYNTTLHVLALFLILILSTLACSFPIIVRRFPRLPVPHRFLFMSRHFGTGVLIATAFVHLLPTAFVSLTDPCLPHFWNKGYPAMAGLIAMSSVLIVVGVEMFFASRGAGHGHAHGHGHGEGMNVYEGLANGGDLHGHQYQDRFDGNGSLPYVNGGANRQSAKHFRSRSGNFKRQRDRMPLAERRLIRDMNDGYADDDQIEPRLSGERLLDNRNEPGSASPKLSPLIRPSGRHESSGDNYHRNNHERSPSESRSDEADNRSDLDLELDELDELDPSNNSTLNPSSILPTTITIANNSNNANNNNNNNSTQNSPQKLLLQCLLLEAGILFHSVFIGMALSVSTGPPFLVLLLAISFHQVFEGFALGARIAALPFPSASPKPWLMALAYGTTTPLGQAIGLAIHNLYDPASQVGLLTVGSMNAVSSGLLVFAGLVELLAEDFLSEESYVSLRGRKRVEACGCVVGGAALMALVGAWA